MKLGSRDDRLSTHQKDCFEHVHVHVHVHVHSLAPINMTALKTIASSIGIYKSTSSVYVLNNHSV
jgi:hypothetical protein